jgi:hypothetical protein
MSSEDYQDAMDRLQLDQLHSVVLQLAKNCFELKKLCVTVIVSAATLVVTFTEHRIDLAFFIGGAIIILFFYVADAQSYYYQEKIRIRMAQIATTLANRHSQQPQVVVVGMPLGQQRLAQSRLLRAFLNSSMWFYAFIFGIDLVLLLLFKLGLLHQ